MTPIPLEVKAQLRNFLEGEMNAASRKQASAVPAIIVRKDELERFLDAMWVSINEQALAQV